MSMLSNPGILARRILLYTLLGGPVIAPMAWSDEGSQIGIDNFKFGPTPLTIEKGAEVTWTNHDDIPHNIVLNALGVRSKVMDTGGTFTYKFDKIGMFFYVCGLHPFMATGAKVWARLIFLLPRLGAVDSLQGCATASAFFRTEPCGA
jgi:plastocyanin